MHVVDDRVLALGQGVPQLDGLVPAARDNLTVVPGEGNAVYVLGVTFESSNGRAGVQVPKTHGLVPGSRQGILAIRRQHSTCHALTVTMKGTSSIAWVLTIRGELPNHQGLVSRGGHHQVALLVGACDGGHPITVAREGTDILQCGIATHRCCFF